MLEITILKGIFCGGPTEVIKIRKYDTFQAIITGRI